MELLEKLKPKTRFRGVQSLESLEKFRQLCIFSNVLN